MLNDLPVFGICGFSGTGKTALIEQLVPLLTAKKLKVAVVKHAARVIEVDRPGKDSDRFFQSGADVLLQGSREKFYRIHRADDRDLSYVLKSLSKRYDIVLVEGGKNLPLIKVWLLSDSESSHPADIDGIVASLQWNSDRAGAVMSILDDWLSEQWLKTPVFGCVLIGGKSTRMGTPKHLLAENGMSWLERTVKLLESLAQTVVIAGESTLPEGIADSVCLPDVPGIRGPMAGILSAMRWAPEASWLVVACDLPDLSREALEWLLSTRRPGVWATIPKLSGSEHVEPLLAHYDFRAHTLLEIAAAEGRLGPSILADNPKVLVATPPDHLGGAWNNVNMEDELGRHRSGKERSGGCRRVESEE